MTEKDIKKNLEELFRKYFYEKPISTERIKGGVSGRIIFKIKSKHYICIGVHNKKLRENIAFIEFSKAFRDGGFKVPEIYITSENKEYYLEEFLGDKSLFEILKGRNISSKEKIKLYKSALEDLVQFQVKGKDFIKYKYCSETKTFNRKQIYYDFDKFYIYFLSRLVNPELTKSQYSEIKKSIADILLKEKAEYFTYRDFQPRNIMLKDKRLYYIDYQSGRKGPMQYDAASFLYSGSIELKGQERSRLLEYYIKCTRKHTKISEGKFKEAFYYFAFIRILQVLGSYGYNYEMKGSKESIGKMNKALKSLCELKKHLKVKILKDFAEILSKVTIHI